MAVTNHVKCQFYKTKYKQSSTHISYPTCTHLIEPIFCLQLVSPYELRLEAPNGLASNIKSTADAGGVLFTLAFSDNRKEGVQEYQKTVLLLT